jgi:hypothetical protein
LEDRLLFAERKAATSRSKPAKKRTAKQIMSKYKS